MQKPSQYDEAGQLLSIGIGKRSKPRRVIQVDGERIPGLERQDVPKA